MYMDQLVSRIWRVWIWGEWEIPLPHPLSAYPWVLSLYLNKGPVTSTHHPFIPRPLDCDWGGWPNLVWPLQGEQHADRQTEREKGLETIVYLPLYKHCIRRKPLGGGETGEEKGRRSVGGCSIWLICSHVLRRWGASSPGGGKGEFVKDQHR